MPYAFDYRLRLVTHARQHGIKGRGAGLPHHRAHGAQVAAALCKAGVEGVAGTLARPALLSAQDRRRAGPAGGRTASSAAHLRGPAPATRMGTAVGPHGHPAHPARARPDPSPPSQVPKETGSGQTERNLGLVPADLRRHQGPRRYPPLLAPNAGPRLTRRPVHGPRGSQWLTVLGLFLPPLRPGQHLVRPAHSSPPRALWRYPPRPDRADRQRQ